MRRPELDLAAGHVIGLGGPAGSDGTSGAYAPPGGNVDLRCAAARWYGVRPETLAVTTGASMALSAALASHTGQKRLLCPRPYYPLYLRLAALFGFDVAFYELRPELDWQPDPGELRRLGETSPGVILVNWPGNPTGSIASHEVLSAISGLRDDRGFDIVSDETYGEFCYDGARHFDLASLIGRHRLVQVKSCSKLLQTPGERVGFAIADRQRLLALCEAHWTLALSPPVSGQIAALRRFEGQLSVDLASLKSELQQNRDRLIQTMSSTASIDASYPAGGLFVWARADPDHFDDFVELAKLNDLRLSRGSAFGARDPSWFRMSFAVSREVLDAARRRLRWMAGQARSAPVIAV